MNELRFPGIVAAARDGRVLADNAAGSQIPDEGIAAIQQFLIEDNAQRGNYGRQKRTSAILQAARERFAELFDVTPDDLGFGANATSISLDFARAIAHGVRPGDRVLITSSDHYANVVPWLWLRRFGAVVDVVPADAFGGVDQEAYAAMLEREPLLVALPWASNVTGTVHPLEQMAGMAAEAGALVVADGVQAAPHFPLSIPETVDFAFFSAYKIFGPHFGVWYAREEVRDRFFRIDDPFLPSEEFRWTMETGTQPFELLAGWLGTTNYLRDAGDGFLRVAMERFAAYESELTRVALAGFAQRADRVRLYGLPLAHERLPVFAFNIDTRSPSELGAMFEAAKIEAGVGNFYAPRLLRTIANEHHGTVVRLSFAHYNTLEDVERCFAVIDAALAR
jgi:selenocysteine lyase/cysteine desulfurase